MSLFTEQRRRCGCPILVRNANTHMHTHGHTHSLTNPVIQSVICTAATVSLPLFTSLAVTHTHTQILADLTRYMVNLPLKRKHLIHQKKINR